MPLRGFVLDLVRGELRTADGSPAALRRKALAALLVLAGQAGHVVGKDELMRRVWGEVVVTEDSLTQLVNEIRRVLGDADRSLVRPVARRGYVLMPDAAPPPPGDEPPAATHLPGAPGRLFGRDADLAAVAAQVDAERLVSVVGPGGIGKTSLAHAVARGVAGRFAHGVWWVDLAMLSEPAQVVPAVAAAARIELMHGDGRRRLIAALAPRAVLLVLDNCEHLVAEVAGVAADLLAAAPHVQVLATSQEPLRVAGERVFRLGVLDVPPEGATLADARRHGAFELFEARVVEADATRAIDEHELPAAIDVCRRLDGVPLAIEMAASRVPALGVAGVQALLGERLRTLRNARRGVPSRQETLRATLEWSCSLLDPNERAVLRRLGVLAGPFDAALAQRIAADEGLDDWAALDALCGLVDKSLVRVERHASRRMRLLESTRLLAREQLAASGEVEATLQRHAVAMADLGRQMRAAFLSVPDEQLMARFRDHYADMERAFEHACSRTDADVAAGVLFGLRSLDQLRGEMSRMKARLQTVQRLLPQATGRARAGILTMIASCGWITLDGLSPCEAAAGAVAGWRALGDQAVALEHGLVIHATELARAGQCDQAHRVLEEARQLADRIGHPKIRLFALIHSGHVAMFCGEPAANLARLREALAMAREIDAGSVASYVLSFLPEAAWFAGDAAGAVSLASAAVHEFRALGQQAFLAGACTTLVPALLDCGELERARHEARDALPLAWEYGFDGEMAGAMAALALATHRPDAAAVLAGYACARSPHVLNARDRFMQQRLARAQREAGAALGAALAAQADARGAALPPAAALDLALRVAREPAPAT